MNNLPQLRIGHSVTLPDNDAWTNRFQVRSETSTRIYTIAQHKTKRHWGCNCPGWLTNRKCKHLSAIGLPSYELPYEANLIKD